MQAESFQSSGFTRVPEPLPHLTKRLVICCDGTWQSSNHGTRSTPSNVAKISRAIAKFGKGKDGIAIPQIVFYDAGVGTSTDSADKGHESWGDWFNSKWGGAFGEGLSENVCEAYNFLVNNYCAGDEVYIFGFSRGAYTARATAGLVSQVGLCANPMMDDFWAMYQAFRNRASGQHIKDTRWGQQEGQWWLSRCHKPVDIKVVGVFDTVGSLGWPSTNVSDHAEANKKLSFHDVSVHPNIEFAFQALAIDERRSPFSPTLWTLPTDNSRTTLIQCWFPGVHINIGGGSDQSLEPDTSEASKIEQWKISSQPQTGFTPRNDVHTLSPQPTKGSSSVKQKTTKVPAPSLQNKGDLETMANITFGWMVDLVKKSTNLAFDAEFMDMIMSKYTSNLSKLGNMQNLGDNLSATVAYRGWGAGPLNDAFTGVKTLVAPLMATNRKPGQYSDVGKTHEYIHPVVCYSLEHSRTGYKPKAFEGFRRKPILDADAFAKFHPGKQPAAGTAGKYGYYWEKKIESSGEWGYSYLWGNSTKTEGARVIQIPEFQISRDTPEFESIERKLILAKFIRSTEFIDAVKYADVLAARTNAMEEDAVAGEKFLAKLDADNGYETVGALAAK